MQKWLLLFIFIYCNFFQLPAQDFISLYSNLKGDVEMIYTTETEVCDQIENFSFAKSKFREAKIETFGVGNTIQAFTYYLNKDVPFSRTYFISDASGYTQKDESYQLGRGKDKFSQYGFSYENDGSLSEIEKLDLNRDVSKRYTYNYQNRELKSTKVSFEKFEKAYLIYYFEKGVLVKLEEFDKKGELKYTTKYEANAYGDISVANKYNAAGNLADCSEYNYEYDEFGNYIKKTEFKAESGRYILTECIIVYKKNKEVSLSPEMLYNDAWINWSDKTVLQFQPDGNVKIDNNIWRQAKELKYSIDATNGKVILNGTSYNFYFDGKHLNLQPDNSSKKPFQLFKTPFPANSVEYISRKNKVKTDGKKYLQSHEFLDSKGNPVYSDVDQIIILNEKNVALKKNKLYALGNYKGKKITGFNFAHLGRLDSKHIRFRLKEKPNSKYGAVNSKGKIILEAKYIELTSCGEGCFVVSETPVFNDCEIIRIDGTPSSFYTSKYTQGDKRFRARVDYKTFKWLDSNMRAINLPDSVQVPTTRIARNIFISEKGNKPLLMDSMGNNVRLLQIPMKYSIEDYFALNHEVIRVRSNEKYGLLSAKGHLLTSVDYDKIIPVNLENRRKISSNDYALSIVALYERDGLIGGLNGFGEDVKFILPQLLNSKAFSVMSLTENVVFKYSSLWKEVELGKLISKHNKSTSIEAKLRSTTGKKPLDFISEYAKKEQLVSQIFEDEINGHKTYILITYSGGNTVNNPYKVMRRDVFVQKDQNSLVHFKFKNIRSLLQTQELQLMLETLRFV